MNDSVLGAASASPPRSRNHAVELDYYSSAPSTLRRLETAVSLRARRRMFELFTTVIAPDQHTRILDVGVTPDQSLADSNFFEAAYSWPERLTATSIEDASLLEAKHPGLSFVRTDGATLPFADRAFDVVVSFAVLEHVGDRLRQAAFVEELLRVADRFFLTTPNRWFPVEVHTLLPLLHWLPQRMHQRCLRSLGLPFWATTDNLNLLGSSSLLGMFPGGADVTLHRHRTLGATSNLIVYGTVGGGSADERCCRSTIDERNRCS